MADNKQLPLGVFLLSLSLLAFELTLVRVYSATLFYHFAFMAISVAMLGLAAAGLTVHRFPKRFARDNTAQWASFWSGAFGLAVIVVPGIVLRIPVDVYSPPDTIVGKLTFIYVLSALPFYFAGMVLSGLFSRFNEAFGKLYAWDLIGAGLGAVAIIPLLNFAGGETAPFLCAAVGVGAAVLFATPKKRMKWVLIVVVLLGLATINGRVGMIHIAYSKGQHQMATDFKFAKWNSISRVVAVPFKEGTAAAYTWCPSPNYPLPIMSQYSLIIDDLAASPVLPFDGSNLAPVDYIRNDLTALAHRLNGKSKTLVIGCGGGRDVLTGLLCGAEKIDAVDINPLIFEAMNGPLASFDGRLYSHPKVEAYCSEGRAFVRKRSGEYDLIQVAMIDTWAATTSGAYSLTENNLYTVEAFEDYLRALKPSGMISFTRFAFEPPREALKLVPLYLEAAARLGVNTPDSCILVAGYEDLMTVIFKRSPFTHSEIAKFKADVIDLGFKLVYAPDNRVDPRFKAVVDKGTQKVFIEGYPFDIRPNTDDRPFFFNVLKIKDFLRAFDFSDAQAFNYYATYTLLVILMVSLAAIGLSLVGPLLIWEGSVTAFPGRGVLFAALILIGLGYIILESTLLQRLVLLLEQPIYAASAVVAGLLTSSGLGSWWWQRTEVKGRAKLFRVSGVTIAALLSLQVVFGSAIIHGAMEWPMLAKILLTGVMLLPLGWAMGIQLPVVMERLGRVSEGAVAWGWGLNGAASVVGAPLAVTISMATGMNVAIGVALACYLGAAILLMGRVGLRQSVEGIGN